VAAASAATVLLARPAAAVPVELFISEYVEGSSSNKALELYNGTGAPIALDGTYDIQIFANGSPTATATVALIGTIAAGDAFVLVRSAADPALLALADQTTANFLCSRVSKRPSRSNGFRQPTSRMISISSSVR
jgi:predicted extracellular nuclease